MINGKEFDIWMKNQPENDTSDHNKALVAFLTDPVGKGFMGIKDYMAFCELGKNARLQYGYNTLDIPCSSLDFGKAVLKATPEVFGSLMPSLPEDVKFELMAEKFHLWPHKKQGLLKFLHIGGILEHIQNYETFCFLANTIQKKYEEDISNSPCTEIEFYQAVFNFKGDYYGKWLLEIPESIFLEHEEVFK